MKAILPILFITILFVNLTGLIAATVTNEIICDSCKTVDSLTLVKANSVITNNIDVIDKVQGFYNSAMSTIYTVLGISIAIVGIIIPLLLEYFRRKEFKIAKEEIETEFLKNKNELKKLQDKIDNEIPNKILSLKIELENSIDSKFSLSQENFNSKINFEIFELYLGLGYISLIKGDNLIQMKHYGSAILMVNDSIKYILHALKCLEEFENNTYKLNVDKANEDLLKSIKNLKFALNTLIDPKDFHNISIYDEKYYEILELINIIEDKNIKAIPKDLLIDIKLKLQINHEFIKNNS